MFVGHNSQPLLWLIINYCRIKILDQSGNAITIHTKQEQKSPHQDTLSKSKILFYLLVQRYIQLSVNMNRKRSSIKDNTHSLLDHI